jgi:hypothetical protein
MEATASADIGTYLCAGCEFVHESSRAHALPWGSIVLPVCSKWVGRSQEVINRLSKISSGMSKGRAAK